MTADCAVGLGLKPKPLASQTATPLNLNRVSSPESTVSPRDQDRPASDPWKALPAALRDFKV